MPPAPCVDTGNPLLDAVPVQLFTGIAQNNGKKIGLVTLRSATTTMTVVLGAEELRTWGKMLLDRADDCERIIEVATPGDMGAMQRLMPTPDP